MNNHKYIDFVPRKKIEKIDPVELHIQKEVEIVAPTPKVFSTSSAMPVFNVNRVSAPRPIIKQTTSISLTKTEKVSKKAEKEATSEEVSFGIIEDYNKSDAKSLPEKKSSVNSQKPNPFLAHVNVEKRPLSNSVPNIVNSTKNVYSQRSVINDDKIKEKSTKIVEKKSNGSLKNIILAVLMIILGVAVGAGIFLLMGN